MLCAVLCAVCHLIAFCTCIYLLGNLDTWILTATGFKSVPDILDAIAQRQPGSGEQLRSIRMCERFWWNPHPGGEDSNKLRLSQKTHHTKYARDPVKVSRLQVQQ